MALNHCKGFLFVRFKHRGLMLKVQPGVGLRGEVIEEGFSCLPIPKFELRSFNRPILKARCEMKIAFDRYILETLKIHGTREIEVDMKKQEGKKMIRSANEAKSNQLSDI